jgi:glutamate decarboxylase
MNKELKLVKANPEYLKKLFIMPDSPDKFIEFGQELLELIHDFFKEKGGIHSSKGSETGRHQLCAQDKA